MREAAARLRIPEFAFFHLAYRRWFGERASDAMLERRFMAFLYGRRVPVWVRQWCLGAPPAGLPAQDQAAVGDLVAAQLVQEAHAEQ